MRMTVRVLLPDGSVLEQLALRARCRIGAALRIGDKLYRVDDMELDAHENLVVVTTRSDSRPQGHRGGAILDFLRYHVSVRVFDGDIDAWLAIAHIEDGDRSFLEWLRHSLNQNPRLLNDIREMVNDSGLWPPALQGGDAAKEADTGIDKH